MKQHGVSRLAMEQAAADSLSSAENDMEEPMDLNRVLVHRPAATFFVRAYGD